MATPFGILIIDPKAEFRQQLEGMLAPLRFPVYMAEKIDQALAIYREHKPAIVIAKLKTGGILGSVVDSSPVNYPSSKTGIMAGIIAGASDQYLLVDTLRSEAKEILSKPLKFEDLRDAVMRLSFLGKRKKQEPLPASSCEKVEIKMSIESRLDVILPTVDLITSLLRSCIGSGGLSQYSLAIQEALRNAYEHGSLGLLSSEKALLCENEELEKELFRREQDAVLANKKIHIHVIINSDEFVCVIEDEGEGFNWRELPQPSQDPELITSLHGRGVLLIRSVFDQLSFNEKGNRLTLYKSFK